MSLIKISPGAKIINSTITDNKQIGGETMIDNQGNIEDSNIERNLYKPTSPVAKKKWFEKSHGILFLGVVASLIAWYVLHYFGLA